MNSSRSHFKAKNIRPAATPRHAFTLIEIIIAVTIFLMVAIALFTFSTGVSRSWQHMMNARNNLSEILVLDRVVSSVLSNVIPFTWKNSDNETYPFIVANSDRLRCAYLHHLNDENEGAIRFAELFLEGTTLYMKYTDRPFYDWSEADDRATSVVLSENVDELHFLYVDWDSDENEDWQDRMLWVEEWETDESERLDAPLAILMTIRWLDGTTESWMYRTMGNGYRERYGAWEAYDEIQLQ